MKTKSKKQTKKKVPPEILARRAEITHRAEEDTDKIYEAKTLKGLCQLLFKEKIFCYWLIIPGARLEGTRQGISERSISERILKLLQVKIAHLAIDVKFSLSPVPNSWALMQIWAIEVLKMMKKPMPIQDEGERSLPLGWKKWAEVFGISRAALRAIRDSKNPQYHFRKTRNNSRKWTLPKCELPAEYLEKYKKATSPSAPK